MCHNFSRPVNQYSNSSASELRKSLTIKQRLVDTLKASSCVQSFTEPNNLITTSNNQSRQNNGISVFSVLFYIADKVIAGTCVRRFWPYKSRRWSDVPCHHCKIWKKLLKNKQHISPKMAILDKKTTGTEKNSTSLKSDTVYANTCPWRYDDSNISFPSIPSPCIFANIVMEIL